MWQVRLLLLDWWLRWLRVDGCGLALGVCYRLWYLLLLWCLLLLLLQRRLLCLRDTAGLLKLGECLGDLKKHRLLLSNHSLELSKLRCHVPWYDWRDGSSMARRRLRRQTAGGA